MLEMQGQPCIRTHERTFRHQHFLCPLCDNATYDGEQMMSILSIFKIDDKETSDDATD